jgi:hypothetical protein
MRAVVQQGIGFLVVATWPGTRHDERRMKNRKRARDFCLVCRAADEPPDLSRAAETVAEVALDALAELAVERAWEDEQSLPTDPRPLKAPAKVGALLLSTWTAPRAAPGASTGRGRFAAQSTGRCLRLANAARS